MRLLIGWCLRGVFLSLLFSLIMTFVAASSMEKDWDWSFYFTVAGVSSTLVVIYFVADYLIDYDEWQR